MRNQAPAACDSLTLFPAPIYTPHTGTAVPDRQLLITLMRLRYRQTTLPFFVLEGQPTMSEQNPGEHFEEPELIRLLRRSRPWIDQYLTTVMYVAAALMAVVAVWLFASSGPPATAAESAELLAATTPEEFGKLADSAIGTPIGDYARLQEAELYLRTALESLFTNRESGIEGLEQAEKAFKRLEDSRALSDDQELRMLLGLARISEARCDGTAETVDAARAAWERLQKAATLSESFRKLAENRMAKLAEPGTQEFYAWFQQQKPGPGDLPGLPQDHPPLPGSVPAIPGFDPSMPLIPDLPPGLPAADSSEEGSDAGTPAEPAAEEAAPEKPAAEENTSEAESGETPADGGNSEGAAAADSADEAKPAESEAGATESVPESAEVSADE